MHYQEQKDQGIRFWADAPLEKQLNFMNDRPSQFEVNVREFWGEVKVWRVIAVGVVTRWIERVVHAPEPEYAYDCLTLLAC